MTEVETSQFWERLYSEHDQRWSGDPNVALVQTVTGLAPGSALDLGSGEGGDSIWLAQQGWHVTAIDIAPTAVFRAGVLATRRGVSPDKITWLIEDLATFQPFGSFDLVSACFLQSPIEFARYRILQDAASAVAPGGNLLVVSHAEPPPWPGANAHAAHFPTLAEELSNLHLDRHEWDTLVSEIRARPATGSDGRVALLRDNVQFLRRKNGNKSSRGLP
jgi:SAM-dependent methyltransferase